MENHFPGEDVRMDIDQMVNNVLIENHTLVWIDSIHLMTKHTLGGVLGWEANNLRGGSKKWQNITVNTSIKWIRSIHTFVMA
jgi:hypothetical protein